MNCLTCENYYYIYDFSGIKHKCRYEIDNQDLLACSEYSREPGSEGDSKPE